MKLVPKVTLGAVWLLALALPAPAFARGEFDPTTEFEQHEWVSIHLGPLNISITKAVVYLMIGTALTILLGLVLMRGKTLNRRQTVGEQIYEVAQVQVAEQGLPSKAIGRWFPVRRLPDALHPRGQPDRFHPAAADRRDLPRGSRVGNLRSDVLDLGDACTRPVDVRVHALRGHPLERAGPLLQELDPGGAEAVTRADRAARDPRPVHAPDLTERPSLREHARRATS